MADFFQTTPNFTNPSYATPEQLAAQRAYAAALTKRSGEDVNRPAGAAANVLTAITAALTRNNADRVQSDAASQNASDQAELIKQLQSGGQPDADTIAHISANPMASPESRALVNALVTQKPVEDVYGRPAYASPATGVQAAPIQGGYTPGYRAPEAAGSVSTTTAIPAPGAASPAPAPAVAHPQAPQQAPGLDAVSPQGGIFGGMNSSPVGWNGNQPPAVVPASGSRIDDLAAKDRELSAAKAFTQGGADSITGTQKEDIAAAMNAPTIKRIAGTMLDDLKTHGENMTFGPTAEWSNTIKRAAANYAPGLMKDQLESLASADSFDKMSAQLTSMLAKGGGTDAQLFNNMRSVPGAHNSKEGAEALLKMVNQVADQQAGLREYVAKARTPQEYEALRSQFFKENPVINPITGNPIKLDVQKAGTQGEETKTIGNVTYIKRNGQWFHG